MHRFMNIELAAVAGLSDSTYNLSKLLSGDVNEAGVLVPHDGSVVQ